MADKDSSSYLQGLVRNAAMPFLYRNGIRGLLAMPDTRKEQRMFSLRTLPVFPSGNEEVAENREDGGGLSAPRIEQRFTATNFQSEAATKAHDDKTNPENNAPQERGNVLEENRSSIKNLPTTTVEIKLPGENNKIETKITMLQPHVEISTPDMEKQQRCELQHQVSMRTKTKHFEKNENSIGRTSESAREETMATAMKTVKALAARITSVRESRMDIVNEAKVPASPSVSLKKNHLEIHKQSELNTPVRDESYASLSRLRDSSAEIVQLRKTVQELLAKSSIRQEEKASPIPEMHGQQREVIVKKEAQPSRPIRAYWERRRLGRFSLRALR